MKNRNYLSEVAQKTQPYTWEFGSGKEVRFNSNTLPFPPKSLKKFLQDMEKDCPINEYADPNYSGLKKLLAKYESVSEDMITITNSGDEAIDILAKTFLNPGDSFVTTPPTYEMFSIQCEINRGVSMEIPLEKNTWNIDAEKIIKTSKNPKTKLIFLCNPNNPTGSIINPSVIEQIVKNSDSIVIIDETYREFYGKSSNWLLNKYSNVVILRSFSKFAGMAGARIGFLIASKNLSKKFDGIRFPMGVSYFSYKLAEEVLKNDQTWIKKQIEVIKKERMVMTKALIEFGFVVYSSEANFLLVNMGERVKEIYENLKERNLYIRDRSSKKNLEDCVRITIRSPKENKLLLRTLNVILEEGNSRPIESNKKDPIAFLQDVNAKKKYAFLDRDGTLIFEPQDTFQIDSLDKLKILDGVIKGLKLLIKQGYKLVMVSNQDGLGTKSYSKNSFNQVQKSLLEIYIKNGIIFSNIFICPHFASENCNCRKPKTGLVQNLTGKIDTSNSFVCGDRETDKLFAKNLGIKYIPMKTNGNFYNAIKEARLRFALQNFGEAREVKA